MNKELEKSVIYNRYIDLFYYSYNIMKKFPKYERDVLCRDIRKILEEGYKYMIYAYNENKIILKLNYLKNIS